MAEDLIKVKDLPIISNYEDVLPDDRVVTTHLSGSTRETVAVTIDALGRKVEADSPNSAAVPRNLFGYEDPSTSDGRNNDLYFKLMSGATGIVVVASYIKINGQWISFQVTDDNWRRFLEGQGFDVISYDATSVKAHAFDGNTEINNVIMPNVIDIYEYAFRGSSIKSASFPSCKHIYEYAFMNTESWRSGLIDLPNIDTIGDHAFDNIHPSSVDLRINIENVKTIGARAFYQTSFWKERTPSNVLYLPYCTELGESAFASFSSSYGLDVERVDLPAIVSIGAQAFRYITAKNHPLELHIGPDCTYIGSNIFWDIDSRVSTDIYIEAVTPPTLVDGFLHSISGDWIPTHLYVPYQSVNAYKEASVWSIYADVIEAVPEEE